MSRMGHENGVVSLEQCENMLQEASKNGKLDLNMLLTKELKRNINNSNAEGNKKIFFLLNIG